MINAKKSLSSCQLARDLELKQKAAWRMMMSIRAEMRKDNVLLHNSIVFGHKLPIVSCYIQRTVFHW